MKNTLVIAVLIALSLLLFACNNGNSVAAAPSPSQSQPPESPVILPGGSDQSGEAGGEQKPPEQPTEESDRTSPYDPSIYVIEASGTWQQELAPGYYVNYECEMYLDKVDSNDNRTASGMYTGSFWMNATIDASEFITDMIGDAPISLQFDAGGEAISDNLTMNLLDGFERDPFKDYNIPGGSGESVSPVQAALADEGSFVALGKSVYLEAHARGAQGEKVDYSGPGTSASNAELNYVIHVDPDPTMTATQLRVTIHLYNAEGMNAVIEGVWKRLPGYPDDVLDYANSGKQNEMLNRHMD